MVKSVFFCEMVRCCRQWLHLRPPHLRPLFWSSPPLPLPSPLPRLPLRLRCSTPCPRLPSPRLFMSPPPPANPSHRLRQVCQTFRTMGTGRVPFCCAEGVGPYGGTQILHWPYPLCWQLTWVRSSFAGNLGHDSPVNPLFFTFGQPFFSPSCSRTHCYCEMHIFQCSKGMT